MKGYGTPIYTNTNYPFPANPPYIPHDDNPVGSYVRTFDIPADWAAATYSCISTARRPGCMCG